eukprot:12946550-Alexandrium_andersonii.AAC.1
MLLNEAQQPVGLRTARVHPQQVSTGEQRVVEFSSLVNGGVCCVRAEEAHDRRNCIVLGLRVPLP